MARVLIVEDEELLSAAFRLILERDNHTVEIANNGKKALPLAANFNPDIIFLDLLMPVMGGLDFLEQYKPKPNASTPIIVVLSNLQNEKNVEQARKLGAHSYIVKSQMTPTDLSSTVTKLLSK